MPAAEHLTLRAHDFDNFADTARSFDWTPIQLSSGSLNLELDLFDTPNFGGFRLGFEPRIHDRSVVSEGFVSFCIAFGQCSFSGVEAGPGTLAVLFDKREYRTTFEPGFSCFEFYCRRSLIDTHPLADLLASPSIQHLDFVFQLGVREAYRLRAIIGDLISPTSPWLTETIRGATAAAVLNAFYQVIAPRLGRGPQLDRQLRRSDLAFAALRQLEEFNFNLGPVELAKDLGVTRRALEQAFRAAFDTSPAQFLLARRLTRVRDRLSRGDEPVIDTAWSEGFQHPSRFAAQYHRLFGERPSETLYRTIDIDRPSHITTSQIG